ncbi:MAG: PilT/PilU family type 4a pilus ATPase [Candidatus Abyssobacteria bacterium SURF_17]|uniref:PilT/PilU family type 4a pilus ATPase n=1 Tax=Candidatus Abyssobacteria bacterium SURF_17 TaxID=2093361 RepID=A0A419EQD9_9BACT|nr:MAG: PilT/PilU family type 4a pilus ATPase [Candidatus Abyssubacteria bacterium SURF_17]
MGLLPRARNEMNSNLTDILEQMVLLKASDCYLKVGEKPFFRVNGEIRQGKFDAVSDGEMGRFMQVTMTDFQRERFQKDPDLDLAHDTRNGNRFRLNVFRQRGHVGMVIRLIPSENLSFDFLHLPSVIREFAELPRGLVIVSGATGSGKTTTQAAMIDHINTNFRKHIVTIEDPVEFIHYNKKSIINQREVGYDTNTFADALKHVVRQSPDVILIGEMRDLETMLVALSASQTGHLVITTLHNVDTAQTLDRIINYFPEYMRHQVRLELSLCLMGVICMRLIPRKEGNGRIPALEIMRTTPLIRKLLLLGDTKAIPDYIKEGREFGMQTFNQALLDLFQAGLVSYEDALQNASNPEEFKLNAQGMFTGIDSLKAKGL